MKSAEISRVQPDCNVCCKGKVIKDSSIFKQALFLLIFGAVLIWQLFIPSKVMAAVDVKLRPAQLDFDFCYVYASESISVTIKNRGSETVTIKSHKWSGTEEENIFTNDLVNGEEIENGKQKTFQVTFSPSLAKDYHDVLSITFEDSSGEVTKTIDVTGHGVFGVNHFISVPGSLNFGRCVIENKKISFLRFINNSDNDVKIEKVVLPDNAPFSLNLDNKEIKAHDMLNVEVVFEPKSIQDFRVVVEVLYDKYVPNSKIILTGSGVYDAENVLEAPERIDFGNCNVGQTKKAALLFVNQGSVDIEIQDVYLPYEGIFSTISGTIPAFGSREFLVEFTPASVQSFYAVMQIIYKNGVPATDIILTGQGTADPEILSAPGRLDYQTVGVGQQKTKILVLTNTGDVAVKIIQIQTSSSVFHVSDVADTLKVGETMVLPVSFTPLANGKVEGSLEIIFDNLPSRTIAMSGTGAEVLFSPSELQFVGPTVGESQSQEVLIINSSTHDLQLNEVVVGTSDFQVSGLTSGDIIPANGGSLRCIVTFHPLTSGYLADNIYLDIGPVSQVSIPENQPEGSGTQYYVHLTGVPYVDFTPTLFTTYTAEIDYRLWVSAATPQAGRLYVLMTEDPLSKGEIYALTADGNLTPFPFESPYAWQSLWYQRSSAPGNLLDLSYIDLRQLGCTQCMGPDGGTGEEFHFGNIAIKPSNTQQDYNNSVDFKYLAGGTLYIATYVKDPFASAGVPFIFDEGLLEFHSLKILTLDGVWRVTSRYLGVDRVNPGLLTVHEANGQISATWPPYPVKIEYSSKDPVYLITFNLSGFEYIYRITNLTPYSFSGSYNCYYKGQVVEQDAPVSGERIR